jgi:hypothetical protein
MSETLHIETPGEPRRAQGRSWIAWMGAATIAIALLVVMWPAERRGARTREAHLPFGSAERAYAPNLQIENLAQSRAENFLNQEVTIFNGQILNAGNTPVFNVEITMEFADELNQIILRESRVLFPAQTTPLAPGARRDFEISIEHIPPSWNIQKPAIHISGVLLASREE